MHNTTRYSLHGPQSVAISQEHGKLQPKTVTVVSKITTVQSEHHS